VRCDAGGLQPGVPRFDIQVHHHTPELVERLNLCAYGRYFTHSPSQQCLQCQHVVITSRDRDRVVEALLAPRYSSSVPRIVVQDVVNHTLHLEHLDRASTSRDRQ
jgi:hypothetical protein